MTGFYPIFLREVVVLRRRFSRGGYILSTFITPVLYFLAFGVALGGKVRVGEVKYVYFLLPGIVGFSSATGSFSWSAISLSLSRLYYKSFEEYMVSPVSGSSIVLGYVLSGSLRGMLGAAAIILVAFLMVGIHPPVSPWFYGALLVNSMVFSSLGVACGMLARSYNDISILSNFFVLPMGFLCGTFFSLARLPHNVRCVVEFLPLTQAVVVLRGSFLKSGFSVLSFVILGVWFFILYLFSLLAVRRRF